MSNREIDKHHVVVLGDLVDGLNVIGPFKGFVAALGWVEANTPYPYQIMACEDPNEKTKYARKHKAA